jgi:hypothetical protein
MQLLFNNLAPVDSHCIRLSAETSDRQETVAANTDKVTDSAATKVRLHAAMNTDSAVLKQTMPEVVADENKAADNVNLNEDSETNETDLCAVFDNLKNAPPNLLPRLISNAFREATKLTNGASRVFPRGGVNRTMKFNKEGTEFSVDGEAVNWSEAGKIKISGITYEMPKHKAELSDALKYKEELSKALIAFVKNNL